MKTTSDVKWVVVTLAGDESVECSPFTEFKEAESYAKAEAKRLRGPVFLFVPQRKYSVEVEVKETVEILP